MNEKLQRIIGLLLSVAMMSILAGCGIFDKQDGEVRPLESKVLFSLKELGEGWQKTSDPEFYLRLSTVKVYGCHRCEILSKVKIVGDSITVELLGVFTPHKCDDSPQRARSQLLLALPDGEYTLLFLYDTVVDSHKLSITPSTIRIAKGDAYLTEPLFSVLQR